MRVTFKIALGLMLFNAIFSLYAPIFNTGYEDGAKDITDEDLSKYDMFQEGGLTLGDFVTILENNAGALGAGGGIFFTAVLIAIASKSWVIIGAGLFLGILMGMYVKFMGIIHQLASAGTGGNIYVTGLTAIIGLAIGVLLLFNVIDMFAPAPAAG